MTRNSGRCGEDVWKDGHSIMVLSGPRSHTIEEWIATVEETCGQRVDWSQCGGRAHVQYLGDRALVEAALLEAMPLLYVAYAACEDNFGSPPYIAEDVQWAWLTDDGRVMGVVR